MDARPEFDPQPVSLAGERARLAPLTVEHAPALFALGRDASIWTWMLGRQWEREEEAAAMVKGALAEQARGQRYPFVILSPDDEVAGTTSYLEIRRHDRGLEIGHTWLGAAFRRTAINTQCKLLLLGHAFDALGAERVQLKTDSRNERSRAAIERLGAHFEGLLRAYQLRSDGTWRDTAVYSITRADWPGVREGLAARL
jgi:RimJ/RimL family protein N-acetyltransferase